MKRATISLPDGLADALAREAMRQSVSASHIVREALHDRYCTDESTGSRPLPFGPLGRSGQHDISERIDEILADEWGNAARDR